MAASVLQVPSPPQPRLFKGIATLAAGTGLAMGSNSRSPQGDRMDTMTGIGATLVVRGELHAQEDITIAGRVEGSIDVAGHTVVVQPGATIEADVHARQIVIGGRTFGSLLAEERLELRSTAEISGDVCAPRLAVADGAGLQGRVQMPA